MNFEIGYGLQKVFKVIAFDLNPLVFDKKICYGLKSKIVSDYKWVVWFQPNQQSKQAKYATGSKSLLS